MTQRSKAQREAASLRIRRMIYAALYLAIALVLPFITGQIPEIGKALSPMHIPVLLCGFMCGWPWGLAVGFIAPLLRSVLFGMPTLFPGAVAMAFELATYGVIAGILYRGLQQKWGYLYIVLLAAMAAGRLMWGLVYLVLSGLGSVEFSGTIFLSSVVLGSIPGIILQLVLIPALVMAMEKAGLSLNK